MRRRVSVCPIMLGFWLINEFAKYQFKSIDEEGCGAFFAALAFYKGEQQ